MQVTTTSLRQGKFETRFWHKVFEEEVGRVKGHFGPVNTSVPFLERASGLLTMCLVSQFTLLELVMLLEARMVSYGFTTLRNHTSAPNPMGTWRLRINR